MSTPDVPQPSGRQPTLIELNQHEDRLAAAASLSKNTNGRAAGSQSPFNPSERVETGIAAAAMINQTYAEQQCGWNSGQSKQAASNPPSLDHATTPAFCNAARPSAVELSLFIKSDGPCTKRISLVEGRIISDGSACAILIGQAAR